MAGRIITLIGLLLLAALWLIQWRQNSQLRTQLSAVRAQVAEREAAQQSAIAQVTEQVNSKLELLRRQNLGLSNRIRQLQTALTASTNAAPRAIAKDPVKADLTEKDQAVQQLAAAVLQGDFTALNRLAELTREAASANRPRMTDEEREQLVANLRPIWSAFDSWVEQAAQGNDAAFRALAQAARIPDLSGLAVKSLGDLAGRGSEGALNVVLDPQKFGVDVPFASTVGALKPAAENGEPRAIQALAALAANDSQQPLWYMAANALDKAAGAGDSTAIEALISFSRSTNRNILDAVRVGLNAAAANQNPRAIEALRELSARRPGP